jgi:hypothetical protein
MNLKPGDTFYSVKLRNLDDYEEGYPLITKSTVEEYHQPTGMIVNTKGRYFRPEECYGTPTQAKAELRRWIDVQRKILDEIEESLS